MIQRVVQRTAVKETAFSPERGEAPFQGRHPLACSVKSGSPTQLAETPFKEESGPRKSGYRFRCCSGAVNRPPRSTMKGEIPEDHQKRCKTEKTTEKNECHLEEGTKKLLPGICRIRKGRPEASIACPGGIREWNPTISTEPVFRIHGESAVGAVRRHNRTLQFVVRTEFSAGKALPVPGTRQQKRFP